MRAIQVARLSIAASAVNQRGVLVKAKIRCTMMTMARSVGNVGKRTVTNDDDPVGSSFKEIEMNEQLQRIVLGVLTSLLTALGPCAATGCATRVTSIGAVSEKPLFVLNVPGASLTVHSLEMTFEHGVDVEDEVE